MFKGLRRTQTINPECNRSIDLRDSSLADVACLFSQNWVVSEVVVRCEEGVLLLRFAGYLQLGGSGLCLQMSRGVAAGGNDAFCFNC